MGFSLSAIQGGWGILMSSSACRSWWGRNCRDTQTHVAHPSQLYHLWHANDDHVNWGHANQSHANQGHANQGPANEVSPGHWSSILGKGLDYWDVSWQRSRGKGLGFVVQFVSLNKVIIFLKSTVPIPSDRACWLLICLYRKRSWGESQDTHLRF